MTQVRGQKAYIASLKAWWRGPLNDSELQPMIDEMLTGDSDRAAVILAVSRMEDELEQNLRSKMRRLNSDENAALFSGDAPLATLSAKIRMAYALSAIGPKTRDDINALREIRNAAAHARRPFTFAIQEVKDLVLALNTAAEKPPGPDWKDPIRARFLIAYLLICSSLDDDAGEPFDQTTRDVRLP
jgi:hypothetical protein